MPETCPRCGLSGTRSVEKRGGRLYIYYVHHAGNRKRKCYVGPLGGYALVERIHTLELDNLESVDYFLVALNALRNYVRRARKEAEERPQMKNELLAKVSRLMDILERLREELLGETGSREVDMW